MRKHNPAAVQNFHTRLPVRLHARLSEAARSAGTSLHEQVLQRLADSFSHDDGRAHRARIRALIEAAKDVAESQQAAE